MKNQQQIEPQLSSENPPINERAWQTWILKNRERDRIGAARRLRALQIILLVVVIVAVVRNVIR